MMSRRTALFLAPRLMAMSLALLALLAAPAMAADARPILSLTDKAGRVQQFSYESLEQMPATSFRTNTPWTEGAVEFEGVAVSDFLAAAGVEAVTLKASALNDYNASFTLEEAEKYGAIIAYKIDGQHFGVRDKGPLWLIYPMDKDKVLTTDHFINHMVWQLDALTVEE